RKPSTIFFISPCLLCPSQPLFLGIIKFKPLNKTVMAQFEKIYIGKGSKIKDLDIVRVSIPREHLEGILNDHMVEYEGKEYFIFEVASLQEADQYGKTHAAYISKKVDNP